MNRTKADLFDKCLKFCVRRGTGSLLEAVGAFSQTPAGWGLRDAEAKTEMVRRLLRWYDQANPNEDERRTLRLHAVTGERMVEFIFDAAAFRRHLYEKPCVVCGQPVTGQGSWFKTQEGNSLSVYGPYCPIDRREPAQDTETVEMVSDSADTTIALMQTPEGIRDVERAIDLRLRKQ